MIRRRCPACKLTVPAPPDRMRAHPDVVNSDAHMKKRRRLLVRLVTVVCAIVGAVLALTLTRRGVLFLSVPNPGEALCVLRTDPGPGRWTAEFRTEKPIDGFHVGVRLNERGQRVRMWLSGDYSASVTLSPRRRATRFTWGRSVPPGAFTLTVEQDAEHSGALVVVADRDPGVTGHQVFSRGLVLFVGMAGVLTWATRRRSDSRLHACSVHAFRALGLAMVCLFAYLLLHEGGHALGAAAFGRFDLSRSDFFGFHGAPHSGIDSSVHVQPWQRAIESFAGPVLPTLVGMAIFLAWRSRRGRRFRQRSVNADLFVTGICTMLLLPFAVVVPAYIMGLVSDGDWRGFIDNVPRPHALVFAILICATIACIGFLWRLVPHCLALLREKTRTS